LDFNDIDAVSEFIPETSREVLEKCQRYYEIGQEENQIIGDGSKQCYGVTDNVAFKQTKIKTPTICMYNAVTGGSHPPSNLGILHQSTRKFVSSANIEDIQFSHGSGSYTSSVKYDWYANSELPICTSNPTYISGTWQTSAPPS
jgi:hypothetical protein